MSMKDIAAEVAALKSTSALASSLIETLSAKVEELEARCAKFASIVSAREMIVRAEVRALRGEVLAPKTVARVSAPRISGAAWDASMADLRSKHPGVTYFARNSVIANAATLVAPEAAEEEQYEYAE